VAGRDVHVGLAQQRLLAEHRARVLGDRRVLVLDLHRDDRARAALVELLLLDLADVDAGDPDVGFLRQRGRLGHPHLEAEALRLERDRAAESQPQEHQQAEHRQGEHHHRDEPAETWGFLNHGSERAQS